MPLFYQRALSLEDYWRGIILFGANTATYKFALGRSLVDLAREGKELVSLEELAEPFARHTCRHLELCDRQITQRSSKFIAACRKFNRGDLSSDQLIDVTSREGFRYVLKHFHVIDGQPIVRKFFESERDGAKGRVRIRQELADLATGSHGPSIPVEVEARWRLVETAWNLNVPTTAIEVTYDRGTEQLSIESHGRRKSITGCRDVLSGYQQGWCFYCGSQISVVPGSPTLADVDHFIPHLLQAEIAQINIDGVWNLVLSCQGCNRGGGGKFGRLAHLVYLEKLHERNEHYIASHHPLRETIIRQTGSSTAKRAKFLNDTWNEAHQLRPGVPHWAPD